VSSQQVLSIIAIAMIANAVLIVIALVSMRASRRRDHDRTEPDLDATHNTMLAMAAAGTGAFGASPSATAGRFEPADRPSDAPSATGATATADEHATSDGSDDPGRETDDETAQSAIMLFDPSTGLDAPIAWRRALDEEVARLARYHRPATVMLIELDGLERLTARLGEAAGRRLIVATAGTIRAQARAADRCAQLGRGRFAVLLPETDEIMAVNFAERVRAECDRWLETAEIALRLAIGWVILDPAEGATPALLEAERRLDAERRKHAGSAA